MKKNNEIINLKGEMKIEYYAAGVFKTPLQWMMILAHPLIPYPERRRRASWFLPCSWSILPSSFGARSRATSWFKIKQPLLGVAFLSTKKKYFLKHETS